MYHTKKLFALPKQISSPPFPTTPIAIDTSRASTLCRCTGLDTPLAMALKPTTTDTTAFAFGVSITNAAINVFEIRYSSYAQPAILAMFLSLILKTVLTEVKKGSERGRLRRLLGGHGAATFGRQRGWGLATKLGMCQLLPLATVLWRQHGRRVWHVWPLRMSILVPASIPPDSQLIFSRTGSEYSPPLIQVLGIDLRDINTMEALSWAFSAVIPVLPALLHAAAVSGGCRVGGRGSIGLVDKVAWVLASKILSLSLARSGHLLRQLTAPL
ncbi:hypothetical protein DFH07DRAFT_1067138 [Mycena maculata]|uniref:Uncharacterized protein n=1 Tax=Mycena maculata TaxID=230809 RepID=A0AAD7MM83_9AGAR|nr:hypothetical protein DFH07DRAFT_1067138 [Mycena maculata]